MKIICVILEGQKKEQLERKELTGGGTEIFGSGRQSLFDGF